MMDVREKLVELLEPHMSGLACEYESGSCELTSCRSCNAKNIADHLIANGVTVQECGYWVSYQSDEPYGCQDEKEWYRCSKCEKDTYGRCYEDKWYSAPILSAYCPHCGAKMMPHPPKGE